MKHYLETDLGVFYESETFSSDEIKAEIIERLKEFPNDLIEHCRDWDNKAQSKKHCGRKTVNLYEVNPKTGNPSLIITKGNKTYYKSLV